MPEGAAEDVEYQRALQQLEDQQHTRAGWLAPRGAFDKGDQAYIREQEERERHMEEAMHAQESNAFLAATARAKEAEEEARRQRLAAQKVAHAKKGPKGGDQR